MVSKNNGDKNQEASDYLKVILDAGLKGPFCCWDRYGWNGFIYWDQVIFKSPPKKQNEKDREL